MYYDDLVKLVLSDEFRTASDEEKENMMKFHLKLMRVTAYDECELLASRVADECTPVARTGALKVVNEIKKMKRFLR